MEESRTKGEGKSKGNIKEMTGCKKKEGEKESMSTNI